MPVNEKQNKKKSYYKPPTAIEKLRHRLADGTPLNELLHYMHGKDSLPRDVKKIAEAAEKLHQARALVEEVKKAKCVDLVAPFAGENGAGEIRAMLNGDTSLVIGKFLSAARDALVMKTMKRPKGE